MNFLSQMMGGLVDKEKETHDVIQQTLQETAEELGCQPREFFIAISAEDEVFEPVLSIYRFDAGKPIFIRKMTIKEILGIEE